MTLLEFSKNRISPTSDQQKAFQALDEFLDSPERCFLLKGYAGTGKTTITKIIAEYIEHKKLVPILLAPTGRAARILQNKTGYKGRTIHSGIYNMDDLDEIEISVGDKKQYKYRYNLNKANENVTEVYLIDEASMISDKISEQDFYIFGSGILLKDVLEYISPWNKARKNKIIFIGDPAQLPPVTDSVSGALSALYLKEKYNMHVREYEMTSVVRQEEGSGILQFANYIRERLFGAVSKIKFEINTELNDISIINPEEVAELYRRLNPELKVNETVIINYSNKDARDYNLLIREKYFQNIYQIGAGDLLMINQNNYNYDVPLLNGTMVKVTNVSPVPLLRTNIPSFTITGEECRVSLKFRSISILLEGFDQELECLILEDLLYSEKSQLAYEEHIALYIDFKIRFPHLKPKTKEFIDTLRGDPYFNALRVKYGYAITCHKAQGGEWESVIINLGLSAGRQSDFFNRWLYTAVTRAEKKLYIFNYRKETIFSKIEFVPDYSFEENTEQDNSFVGALSYQLPVDIEEKYEQFQLTGAEFFQKEKFKEILARADYYGYKLISRKAHNYQEQYTFEKEGRLTTLIFWYGGIKQFTRITILNPNSGDKAFNQSVFEDFNRQLDIVINETGVENNSKRPLEELEEKKEILFEKENESLKPLYDALSTQLTDYDILISNISHLQNREDYTFQRGVEKAEFQFYYDGQGKFTKVFNVKKECNSTDMVKTIGEAIFNLKNN